VSRAPRASIGLPVRNGEQSIGRAIESVLGQSFGDLELVISDNASTDATLELCRSYAERDPRVRVFPNEENIGLLRNYNRVVELSTGEYFRWLGADDWLEPRYLEKTIAVLDARPECVGATTYQAFHSEDGERLYREHPGPWADDPDPTVRYVRMLWFLRADYRLMDPNYSLFRRQALLASHMQRFMPMGDFALALEMALKGSYFTVPECLANRERPPEWLEDVARRLTPPGWQTLRHSDRELLAVLLADVWAADLTWAQRLRCSWLAFQDVSRAAGLRAWRSARGRLAQRARSLGLPVDRLKRAPKGLPRG